MIETYDGPPHEPCFERAQGTRVEEESEHRLFLGLDGSDDFFVLDGPGKEIWKLLEQPRSTADLVKELTLRYRGDDSVIRRDLEATLTTWLTCGLIIQQPS